MRVGWPEISAMVGPAQKDSPTKEKKVKIKGLRAILEAKKPRSGVGKDGNEGGPKKPRNRPQECHVPWPVLPVTFGAGSHPGPLITSL
jgi:hypothetical protein